MDLPARKKRLALLKKQGQQANKPDPKPKRKQKTHTMAEVIDEVNKQLGHDSPGETKENSTSGSENRMETLNKMLANMAEIMAQMQKQQAHSPLRTRPEDDFSNFESKTSKRIKKLEDDILPVKHYPPLHSKVRL